MPVPRLLIVLTEGATLASAIDKAVTINPVLGGDIELLYVHTPAKGMPGSGKGLALLHTRIPLGVAPGIATLQAACRALAHTGWLGAHFHFQGSADGSGDQGSECRDDLGRSVRLWHRIATSVTAGVREHCRNRAYSGLICDQTLYAPPAKASVFGAPSVVDVIKASHTLPPVIDHVTADTAPGLLAAHVKRRRQRRQARHGVFSTMFRRRHAAGR